MVANKISIRSHVLISSFLFVAGVLALNSPLARAQSIGDWQTAPGLAGASWDNSTNNSLGNSNTWQMWNGSAWVTESGATAGTSYPSGNTGLITILPGTTITNATASGSTLTADGIIVQSNASFEFYKSTFYLSHADTETNIDMDVFGNLLLTNSSSGGFSLNGGATIVVENGGTMTNYGATSGDNFVGSGYGYAGAYVPGAITFRSNSLFVLAAATNKGTIPAATWQPGSTCLIAPPSSNTTNFIPVGFSGQNFYNFIWYWPTANGKNGGSGEQGSFTVNGNFAMTGNSNGMVTNEDFPNVGYALTVVGNFGLTNINYFPAASAGTVTLMLGGNVSIDSTATIKINSASGMGNVFFNGTNGPQTVGFYGPNSLGSPGAWNWTVNSNSTVNLNSAWTINGGSANLGGALNINGTLNLTANGSITGTSNIITVAPGAVFNVSPGSFTFAAEDTLQGAGTITGNVTAGSSSVVHPGTGAALTFNGSLTYGSVLSTNIFNLTSSTSGANDQIVVNGGTLTANNAQIVINPVSTLSTSDYVLFKVTGGGTISSASAFNTTPAWVGTPPANSAQYNIVTTGTEVLLHYGVVAVPQPGFTSVSLSGANLLINGTNGTAGTYVVLMNTNLTTTNWTPVATNVLTGSGNFSFTATNAVNPGASHQFYILKAP
jgi:hypothetical protein